MYERFIAKKHQNVPVDLFSEAQNLKQGLSDVIDLSIGDPDINVPEPILTAGYKDSLQGYTHYTPYFGYPDVIQAVVDYYKREMDIDIKNEDVYICASAGYAGWLSCLTVLDPGDEVLVPDPCFTSYMRNIKNCGAIPVPVPTYEKDGWRLTRENIESRITPKTKVMFINSPNNPTGAILTKEDLEMIADIAKKYDLLIISDEIYTWYSYAAPFTSMLTIPGMAERTMVINSMSKNYVFTGARLGWIVAPREILKTTTRLGESMVFTAPAISQRMAKFALNEGKELMQPAMDEFRKRMLFAAERINQIPNHSTKNPPDGTFYLFVNIKDTGLTSDEYVLKVLKEAHVVVVPGTSFGAQGQGYVRMCATKGVDKLGEAFDRIQKLGL